MTKTTILLSLLLASLAFAEIPALLNYQGVLKDAEGGLVEDAEYVINFKLYESPTGVDHIWQESQNINTTNGIFNAILGINSTIENLPSENAYLGISINGGSELLPRKRLVSVGYAFKSRNADFALHSQVSDTSAFANVAGDAQLLGGMPADSYRVITAYGSVETVTCDPGAWTTLLEVDITIPETMLVYSFGTVTGGGWYATQKMLQLSLYDENYSTFYPYANPWGDIANAHHLLEAGLYHIQLYGLNTADVATDMGNISVYALAVPVPTSNTYRKGPFSPPPSAQLPDPSIIKTR
jgi:hypothetical protein